MVTREIWKALRWHCDGVATRWHSEARMMEWRFSDDTCITVVPSWSNCSGIVHGGCVGSMYSDIHDASLMTLWWCKWWHSHDKGMTLWWKSIINPHLGCYFDGKVIGQLWHSHGRKMTLWWLSTGVLFILAFRVACNSLYLPTFRPYSCLVTCLTSQSKFQTYLTSLFLLKFIKPEP